MVRFRWCFKAPETETSPPDSGLSLGELAAILSRTFGYIDSVDVSVNPAWAAPYVQKAVATMPAATVTDLVVNHTI